MSVPEDVANEAKIYTAESFDPLSQRWYGLSLQRTFESAIMMERERCAKIAEDMYLDMMQDKDMRGVRERHEWVWRDIASAIRGTS